MGRKGKTLKLNLSAREVAVLTSYLSGKIGKGSVSTSPAWARGIVHKISAAARSQWRPRSEE